MKRKVIKIALLIAILMTTVFVVTTWLKTIRATATNEMVSTTQGKPSQFPYVTYSDLIEKYDILCCQYGAPLPSYNATLVSSGKKSSPQPYLTENDIGKKLFEETVPASGNTSNPYTSASNLTYGYYTASEAKETLPDESYILSEMSENVYIKGTDFYNITQKEYEGEVTQDFVVTAYGQTLYGVDVENNIPKSYVVEKDGKYYYVELTESESFFPYTYVQYAWWSTEAGGSANVTSTALLKEAEAFKAYIEKVAKRDSNGEIVKEEKTVTIHDKTVKVKAPVIDYKVKGHSENAEVKYDETEKKYLIGPFSIDYYEEAVTSSRGTIEFSGITGTKLESNLGEVNSDDWKFVYINRETSDKAVYPHNGEEFYIILNYIEGMTEITDFKFDFRYMNAAGEYSKLNGTYLQANWEPKSEAVWCTEPTSYCSCGGTYSSPHNPIYDDDGNIIGYKCNGGAKKCSHGFYHSHIVEWKYWLELTDLQENNSQTLAQGIQGARWYETKSISLLIELTDKPKEVIKLTIPMAGNVWIDKENDKKNDTIEGIKEEGELPYEKAEVYVYKVFSDNNGKEIKRELAKIYDEDNITELSFPIYTDAQGKYNIPNMPVPGTDDEESKKYTISYDIKFRYDGQNYEPTTFLPTGNGNASNYINANKSERDKYANDSMATENEQQRDEFNKKFEKISGGNAIDSQGNTKGKTSGDLTIDYTSTEYTVPGDVITKRKSSLTTKDSNGYTLEQYKMDASTGNVGLKYPFDKEISIDTADDVQTLSIKESNNTTVTTYRTIYNYMLHINLGLKERTKADLGVTKDLYKAEIVVNEKELTERYNSAYDLEKPENKELLETQIESAKTQSYTLGLYSSDYAYRSTVYNTTANVVKEIKAGTELKVFATYKIAIFNESDNLDAVINELADYYDTTFTLITDDVNQPILDEQGNRITKKVAEGSYYRIIGAGEVPSYDFTTNGMQRFNWGDSKNVNKDYNKMTTTDLSDIKLKAGERLELFVTYEVNQNYDKESKERPELLGEKNNVAEIASYSTYFDNGKVAGRIDKDSAPDNIDLNRNEKAWYEDDTESAPVLNITLNSYNREVNGTVWEDSETEELKYEQKVGDGIYDSAKEKGIPNIDVELVEKIDIDGVQYEYVWPKEAFAGTPAEGLYNSITKTGEDGKYSIKGFVAGNYVVRFKYGNSEENIKYNGQDYKNTAYQSGITDSDGNTTLNSEWHDLSNKDLTEKRVSDARDYELQRMKVIAYSRTISNKQGEVLESADDETANHDELIKNAQMVANTAKLNVEIEHQQYVDYGNVKSVNGVNEYTYVVENIDFGLEKRSETILELNKKLTGITLTKLNDQEIIMQVIINPDGTINKEKSTHLEKLLRQTPIANEQGFSYIMMEQEYLNNLTVKLDYEITITNKSEVDWTGKLAEFTTPEKILEEVEKLETQPDYISGKAIEYGKYVGLNYYTNKNSDTDKIVTSKVEKVVDYVDNNIGNNIENNTGIENKSWKTISVEELKNQDLLSDNVYTDVDNKLQIVDNKGISYENTGKNNILVSESSSFNPSLVAELVPEKYTDSKLKNSGEIYISTLENVTSGIEANDMIYNNISEILTYSNTVGRRDSQSVPGNAQISRGEYEAASGYTVSGTILTDYNGAKEVELNGKIAHLNGERDTSASEYVTFAEPTGIRESKEISQNYIIYVLIAGIVLAVGILIIKKTLIK